MIRITSSMLHPTRPTNTFPQWVQKAEIGFSGRMMLKCKVRAGRSLIGRLMTLGILRGEVELGGGLRRIFQPFGESVVNSRANLRWRVYRNLINCLMSSAIIFSFSLLPFATRLT